MVGAGVVGADEYPQWLGPQRDGVYREQGLAEGLPTGGLKPRWRAAVGAGYSQVAVAGDKVVVTDRVLAAGAKNPENPFDRKNEIPGAERVLCFDDATGKELWRVEYDCPYTISYAAGPRATPAIDGGRVYTLGAEGHVHCVELDGGRVAWKRKLEGKTAIWGYAGSPLVEGDLLIVLSSGKPLLTALDKRTGDVVWTALDVKDPGYVPPTPMTLNGRRVIVQYHPFGVAGVDPKTGKVLWEVAHGPEQNGVAIVTPVQLSADTFLLTSQYTGFAAVRVSAGEKAGEDKAQIVWHARSRGRTPTALHSLHSPMVLEGGHVYGVQNTGELMCLDAKDGRAVWVDPKPLLGEGEPMRWSSAFLTPWRPDEGRPARQFFLATEKGELIVCRLSPQGYQEVGRARLLEPTNMDAKRPTLWCHPTYAHRSLYWRNDKELVRVGLE